MKKSLSPEIILFEPYFVQIEKYKGGSLPYQYAYIYKLYAYSKKFNAIFKYIIRAEAHNECFAIKFYCSRAKHSDFPYSKILDIFSSVEVKKLLFGVSKVILMILEKIPTASFCFNGARTNVANFYTETMDETKRYRVYIELLKRFIGEEKIKIEIFPKISSCILINKNANNKDTSVTKNQILNYMTAMYDIDE